MAEIKIKLTIDGKESIATLDLSDKKLQQLINTSKGARVATDSMTIGFQKLASTLLGVFAISKITGLLKDSVKAFAEEEQTIAMLKETVGGATGGLVEYAKELEKVTGMEDDKIMMASKMIGDFIKDEEMIKRVTKATVDYAAAKKMDLVSASNLVTRALVGESDTLNRVKLNIDKNATGTERYNQILREMEKLFGGQAEAAASGFTGTLNRMQRAVDNLKESIGERLVGVLAIMAEKFGDMATKANESKGALMSIEVIARTLGIIFAGLTQIVVTIGAALGGLFGMIGKIAYELPNIIEGLARAGTGNLLGSAIASNAVDNIGASFNKWMSTMGNIQSTYGEFYNLMLNPRAKLGNISGGSGSGGSGGFGGGGGGTKEKSLITTDVELQKQIQLIEGMLKGNISLRERILLKEKLKKLQDELNSKEEKSIANDELAKGSRDISERQQKERLKDFEKELQLKREEEDLQSNISALQNEDAWSKYISNIDEQADSWEDVKRAARPTIDTLSRGLSDAVIYGRNFNDVLKNIFGTLMSMSLSGVLQGLFAMLPGGSGFLSGFLGAFGIKANYSGGIINEPVMGVGLQSKRLWSFGEKGYEMVSPLNRTITQGAASGPMNINLTLNGEFTQRGKDLYAVVNSEKKIIKRYK